MGGSGFKNMSKDKNQSVSVSMKLPVGINIKSMKTTRLSIQREKVQRSKRIEKGGPYS